MFAEPSAEDVPVGLGGLGGQLLEQLGRAGVGQFVAVEPDVFDQTNLNRQLLSNEANLGKEKVNAQLYQVIGIMKTCRDMDEFKQKFAYIFKKEPYQTTFFDLVDTYRGN